MKGEMSGQLVNVFTRETYPAKIEWEGGVFTSIEELGRAPEHFIIPGLIDAHMHIESSFLCPSRFAGLVVPRGTCATITDPHEMANVCGIPGVKYMLRDSAHIPLKCFFTAPSCVPSTQYETSGASIGPKQIDELMRDGRIVALGEVMNYPAVIKRDKRMMAKIAVAKKYRKPIDGHAPLLTRAELCKYVSAGISTDHECTKLSEANEKARLGMIIHVRESSAAKDMKELSRCKGIKCLVSDDMEPDDLLKHGHMDRLLRLAVENGIDPVEAIRMCSLHPSRHYGLGMDGIAPRFPANFAVCDNLRYFNMRMVFIDGNVVADNGKPLFRVRPAKPVNNFHCTEKAPEDFMIRLHGKCWRVNAIGAKDAEIHTRKVLLTPAQAQKANIIAVVERYGHGRIGKAHAVGFNIRDGAFGLSVSHDSHNIIAVGSDAASICKVVNRIIGMKGGIAVLSKGRMHTLPLPVGGLMSDQPAEGVARKIDELEEEIKRLGCTFRHPMGTLSFMALPVIPEIKISDKGLFDSQNFEFMHNCVEL
ncbi:MAG: adenine deaminase [Candidatus ainarchaeum sp.]|nr:adenine deaminase [Candidatus ainarchaeum sp.]